MLITNPLGVEKVDTFLGLQSYNENVLCKGTFIYSENFTA